MISLLLLDVDGTLTNGQITYTHQGDEIKSFDVKDGLAISAWKKLGNHVAIITGRKSSIVERRAKELGITHCFQGVLDKYSLVLGLAEEFDIDFSDMAAMGDDLNDLRMLAKVGQSFAPNDAVMEVKERVHTVVDSNGGEGAVREMIEMILKNQNKFDTYLGLYL